jgi:F0F1-type ATP synthase gamma subunit
MANLKAIRDRIKSVKKKITEAMRLVAAAKVRRAQEQVIATRPLPIDWRKCYTACKPVSDLKM